MNEKIEWLPGPVAYIDEKKPHSCNTGEEPRRHSSSEAGLFPPERTAALDAAKLGRFWGLEAFLRSRAHPAAVFEAGFQFGFSIREGLMSGPSLPIPHWTRAVGRRIRESIRTKTEKSVCALESQCSWQYHLCLSRPLASWGRGARLLGGIPSRLVRYFCGEERWPPWGCLPLRGALSLGARGQ